MAKGPAKRDVRITLRLPDELAKLVQAAADDDRRSKSDWIVIRLEAIFKKKRRKPAASDECAGKVDVKSAKSGKLDK